MDYVGWSLLGNKSSRVFPEYARIFDQQLRKKKQDEEWLRNRLLEYRRVDRAYDLAIQEAMSNPIPEKHESCQWVVIDE